MVTSYWEDFLKAEPCHLPQARPAPLLFQGSYLEETESSEPAGPALLILTAEDVEALVAISKLVGLGERKWSVPCLILCPVATGQRRAQGLPRCAGIAVIGWVSQDGVHKP